MCFFTLTIHPFPHLLMLYLWHHNCTSIKTLTCNSEERLLHRSNPEKKPGCLTRKGMTWKFSDRHLPSCCISHTNATSFCYIYLPSPSTTGESGFSQLISANMQLPRRNYVLFIQTAAQPSTSFLLQLLFHVHGATQHVLTRWLRKPRQEPVLFWPSWRDRKCSTKPPPTLLFHMLHLIWTACTSYIPPLLLSGQVCELGPNLGLHFHNWWIYNFLFTKRSINITQKEIFVPCYS